MVNDFISQWLLKNLTSLIRGGLFSLGGAIGAWLVAKGMINADAVKDLINWLTSSATEGIATFVVTTLVPLIWAFVKNHKDVKMERAK